MSRYHKDILIMYSIYKYLNDFNRKLFLSNRVLSIKKVISIKVTFIDKTQLIEILSASSIKMYSKKLFIQNTVKSAQQFQHFLKAFKKLV